MQYYYHGSIGIVGISVIAVPKIYARVGIKLESKERKVMKGIRNNSFIIFPLFTFMTI